MDPSKFKFNQFSFSVIFLIGSNLQLTNALILDFDLI